MDDIVMQHSIRILLGVITLAGILWGAIKYMVNYTVDKSENRNKQRLDQFRAETKTALNTQQHEIGTVSYKLEAHLKNEHPKLDARLRVLETRNRAKEH